MNHYACLLPIHSPTVLHVISKVITWKNKNPQLFIGLRSVAIHLSLAFSRMLKYPSFLLVGYIFQKNYQYSTYSTTINYIFFSGIAPQNYWHHSLLCHTLLENVQVQWICSLANFYERSLIHTYTYRCTPTSYTTYTADKAGK